MADLAAIQQAEMESWLQARQKYLPKDRSMAAKGDLETASYMLIQADTVKGSSKEKICRALMVRPSTKL